MIRLFDHRSVKLGNEDRSSMVGCHLHLRALPGSNRVESMPNEHIFSLREFHHIYVLEVTQPALERVE